MSTARMSPKRSTMRVRFQTSWPLAWLIPGIVHQHSRSGMIKLKVTLDKAQLMEDVGHGTLAAGRHIDHQEASSPRPGNFSAQRACLHRSSIGAVNRLAG